MDVEFLNEVENHVQKLCAKLEHVSMFLITFYS
jgi:hypothetical protein